jgi:FemAB-related protein (PEP-CTERM system-associated)
VKVAYYQDEPHRWDEYVARNPQGTIFHTMGWKQVIEGTFRYRPQYLVAEDNGSIMGCLPLFHTKLWPFHNGLMSVPFGMAAGICADNEAAGAALLEEACTLTRKLGATYLELRHAYPNGFQLETQDLYYTFEREIFGDDEKNMAAIPRKQRRMVREGIKAGLTSTVSRSEEDLGAFYEIYAHSVRNLGTPVFPHRYFQRLLREYAQRCVVLSVWHQNVRTAAVLAFSYRDRLMPLYGGSLRHYQRHAVNDFMYWELMRWGCAQGLKIFDFGRSKKGTGAFDFKRHWGFEPRPLPYQYFLPQGGAPPSVNPLNPKYRYFITTWKKLPLPITKLLGPALVRMFP